MNMHISTLLAIWRKKSGLFFAVYFNLTLITLQTDRTFSFVMSSPPTSYFLKAAAGLEKGASQPGQEVVGSVSVKHIYEIALVKAKDPAFEGVPLQSVCRCVAGSARSMGISITN